MREWMNMLIVGLGGFVGANLRYLVGKAIAARLGTAFPFGTFIINITGCFILGCFAALFSRYAWNDQLRLLIAVGFVGAYTTFSTFEYDTLLLVAEGAWSRALFNMMGSVLLGYAAAYVGVLCGRSLILHN